MNNSGFLNVAKASFKKYLETGARSNEKLKIFHGAISEDLYNRLNDPFSYHVYSLGFGHGTEKAIQGRYINKWVDITVTNNSGEPIAGIAVKYVMSNYQQNSNNYFENMLGETANIRCSNIPYFQMFIIPEYIPYFDNSKQITKWEHFDIHNIEKYIQLSKDNVDSFLHTPNKTLVAILDFNPSGRGKLRTLSEYRNYYLNNHFEALYSEAEYSFSRGVVYNDYDLFMNKVVHTIKGL